MEKKEYDKLREEEESWYFASRRYFFSDILEKFYSKKNKLTILDLGCGSGQMFKILGKYGRIAGLEPSLYALNYAPKNGFKVCGNGTKIPFKDNIFDLATAFGVLEHIENEKDTLKELSRVLKKNGSLIVEVPAYQFLWSGHDVALHHQRRYTENLLTERIKSAGFEIKKSGYLFGGILPWVIRLRMLKKIFRKEEIKTDSFEKIPSLFANRLVAVNKAESKFVKSFYMPFGVSVFAYAEKKN